MRSRIPSICGVLRPAGAYNIPNVGLFLWRLDAFAVRRSPAFRVDDERFLFSPLGNNQQLFTRPRSEADITHLAEPLNVPEPISHRVLDTYLAQYYGLQLSLFLEADNLDTSLGKVQVCNLSDNGATWAHLPVSKVSLIRCWDGSPFPPGTPPVNLRDVSLWVPACRPAGVVRAWENLCARRRVCLR